MDHIVKFKGFLLAKASPQQLQALAIVNLITKILIFNKRSLFLADGVTINN